MVLAGLGRRTQLNYLYGVRRLAAEFHRSPDLMTEEDVRGYLLGLRGRGVARGTFKTSHYGLRFLYRETLGRDWALVKKKIREPKQKRLPDALADAEVRLLLAAVRNPAHRCCFSLIYACGLRISEAATLHVGAIDRPHMLRHSCGFALANRGYDLRLIQDYLGHRDPKHTARYTRVASSRFEGPWR